MLIPHLHLNGRCREALALYEKAFLTKTDLIQYISDTEPEKGVVHAEIHIHGQRVMLNDRGGNKDFLTESAMQMVVIFGSHGCKYCYAMYSYQYLDSEQYFDDIYVKTNIVEQLEQQLSNTSWKREVVNIGGVTDSYQPIEEQYKLMPDILRLMIKYRTPCIISTKSDLILRDYDLIEKLANITYVNIAATVTCMDEIIRRKIEPNGVESVKRFAMLKEFAKTNASTGLHFMPIIPYITDGRDNVDSLYSQANDSKVDYVLRGTLYLRGKTRVVFFDFIKQEFPDLYLVLQELYKTGGAGKEYKDKLYMMVNELKVKYNLSSSYSKPMKEKMNQSVNIQILPFNLSKACYGKFNYCYEYEKVKVYLKGEEEIWNFILDL